MGVVADENHPFWQAARGQQPPPPCAQLTGWTVLEAVPGSGRIKVEFTAPESMINPLGHIQGGFVAAMLDDTMGPALATTFETGEFGPTLELKVSFLRPVLPGRVLGEGRVLRRTGSVAVLEGVLTNPAGELLACGSATTRLIQKAL